MASSGRPASSSARQASGPGALPWHSLRALRKLVVSGSAHHPRSAGARVPQSWSPWAEVKSAAMPWISGAKA
eukprot:10051726-Alexandrium_andersonii.AAC.1